MCNLRGYTSTLVSEPSFSLASLEPTLKSQTHSHLQRTLLNRAITHATEMSSSLSLEERFEALMKNCEFLRTQNEEKTAQNEYLRKQLHDSMRRRRRALRSSSSSRTPVWAEEEREEPHPEDSPSEDGSPRHPRRERRLSLIHI